MQVCIYIEGSPPVNCSLDHDGHCAGKLCITALRGGTSTRGREAMYLGTSGFHEGRDEQSPCVVLVDHVACRCRRPRDRPDVCDDVDCKTGLTALEGNLLAPEDAAALRGDSTMQQTRKWAVPVDAVHFGMLINHPWS